MKNPALRRCAVALLALLIGAALAPRTLAAPGVGQVNLHVGQTADTVYLTYTSGAASTAEVTVTGPEGKQTYAVRSAWSDTAGKYIHKATLTGLSAGEAYAYTLENGAYANTFTTLRQAGGVTFAFLTDTQAAYAADARSTAALFAQLNRREDLSFVFMAGDFTDAARNERQWERLFQGGGIHAGAAEQFLGSHLLAAAQGNHDNSTFSGHIAAPSAAPAAGRAVYSFDCGNVKMAVLNLNSASARQAQADFLRQQAAQAKAAGQWLIVGFHHSLYSGAGHIVDSFVSSARKFWAPLFSQLGVDVVLQGHDHVYARGFVTAQGRNAGLRVQRNAYSAGSGAPLYLTGGTAGAVKWYSARNYSVPKGDLLAPNYGFLEVNSSVPAQNPWGTDSSKTREQTYTLISAEGDELRLEVYMLRYDGKADRMAAEPYLYDSLILRRGSASQADRDALAKLPPVSWNADLADRPMTRQESVTALYRLAGSPAAGAAASFPDVPETGETAQAVAWAVEQGIVYGLQDGTFAPEGSVTRWQFAVFAHRFCRSLGQEMEAGSGVGTYRDWRQVPPPGKEALSWAVHTGLLQGRRGDLLAPNAPMSQAEGAVCMERLAVLASLPGGG